jgi:acetate kinase
MTAAGGQRRILTVNAGSTSVRLALFEVGASGRRVLAHDRLAAAASGEREALAGFLGRLDQRPDVTVHRVVHGGVIRDCRPFDRDVRQAVEAAAGLAPLHNPATLAWLSACEEALPGLPALAVFDTGFFADLPEAAATYGLPRELSRRLGLRRLGFHGLAHRSMWQTFRRLSPVRHARVISLQLGGGCSAAALRDGRPVETSMGFSPLEGLLMASRPGDLDAGALLYLMEREGLDTAAARELLHRRCGLQGLAGTSDLRQVLESPAPEAALALEVFCHRVKKYLGAYLAVLGGCDAILIGGGAGEGSPELRRRIFEGLKGLGMALDPQRNASARAPAAIGDPAAPVDVWVIPTDEESVMVDEACRLLGEAPPSGANEGFGEGDPR